MDVSIRPAHDIGPSCNVTSYESITSSYVQTETGWKHMALLAMTWQVELNEVVLQVY